MTQILLRRKGFTLIELIVYMGILSILLVIFIDMFGTLVARQLETQSSSAVQQDASFLFSKFQYDFEHAKSIQFPATPSTPSSTLILVREDLVENTYYVSNQMLISSASGEMLQMNSAETTISNLTFQRLGDGSHNDVIQIKCDVTSKVNKPSGYEVNHFSTTLGVREN